MLDGFYNFLGPKLLSELVPACAYGPVVIIDIHVTRCDALILLPSGETAHLPLLQLSYDGVTALFQ
jgi:hypothetical protein